MKLKLCRTFASFSVILPTYARLMLFFQIIDDVLPLLYEIRLSDPDIVLRVVSKY